MHHTILNYKKELHSLGYSKNVVNNYPKYAQQLINFCQELPENISTENIKNYHQYLQNKPNQRKAGNISESHIYSQLLAIKLYFDYLQKTKIIIKNPYHLKVKQPTKNQRKILTQEEIKILYQNCKNLLEINILNLCYGCGLRRNEVILLNIKDLDFEKKLLYIRKGKGKKRRVIPLTTKMIKDFRHYLKQTESFRKVNTILVNRQGNIITGNKLYLSFKNLLKRTANINENDYCLHSLRHAIASHLLENDMRIEMVRDFLGHSQLITTQIYTRINLMKND
jgi:integrase/recombinase XerD